MYFQGNINNSLEETYASIINSILKCEEIIIKDTPNLNSRKIENTIDINVTSMKNGSMVIDEENEENINLIKSFNELDGETNDIETSLRFIKWGVSGTNKFPEMYNMCAIDKLLVIMYYIYNKETEVKALVKDRSPILEKVMDSLANNTCDDARHIVVQHNFCHKEKLSQSKKIDLYSVLQDWMPFFKFLTGF
jgi:hypothetical protein